MKIKKSSRKKLDRKYLEKRDVILNKMTMGIVSLRLTWIFYILIGLFVALLLGPIITVPIIILNILISEYLVKKLKAYSNTARVFTIYYLAISIVIFLVLSTLLGVFYLIAAIQGIMGLKDSRTKKLFIEQTEKAILADGTLVNDQKDESNPYSAPEKL